MAAPKRETFEAENDRMIIARLYLQRKTQSEIAAELNARYNPRKDQRHPGQVGYKLSQQTVSRDILIIQQRWVESSLKDFDQARAHELARIDEIERHAWNGWMRSCGQKTTTTLTRRGKKKSENTEAVKTEEMVGNPRFLEVVKDCVVKRCELLGLDPPKRIDLLDTRSPRVMKDAEIEKELLNILNENGIDHTREN